MITTAYTPLPRLSERLRDVCRLDGARVAIEFEGRSHTWQYLADANAALDVLCEPYGGRGRHRVGVVLRNRPGHAAAVIATIATGRCLVTLSAHHGPVMLLEDLREQRPSVVAASPDDWTIPGLIEAAREIGALAIACHSSS